MRLKKSMSDSYYDAKRKELHAINFMFLNLLIILINMKDGLTLLKGRPMVLNYR